MKIAKYWRLIVVIVGSMLNCILAYSQMPSHSYDFKWSAPETLTPSYPAPTMQNREGDCVSLVVFSSGPVKFSIEDDEVQDVNGKARFVYGYNSRAVELRASERSEIIIKVPETEAITQIIFKGDKVSDDQMEYEGAQGAFTGQIWTAKGGQNVSEVRFYLTQNIICSSTSVLLSKSAVDEIEFADDNNGRWYTASGIRLNAKPVAPGFYLCFSRGEMSKIIIR